MNETTPAVRNPLGEQQRQVLEPVLQASAGLAPIGEFYSAQGRQAPADPKHVFELRKNGSQYALHATDSGTSFIPPADGEFLYVIKASDPGRVYVAIDQASGPPALRGYGVAGHTSFDNGGDVLYAGMLSLNHGRLVGWDNSSGHYRPSPAARHTNLLPVVRNLLTENLFSDVQKPLTLRVGTTDIAIEDLRAMGARVDGRRLWRAAMQDGLAALRLNLENRIQFDAQYMVGKRHGAQAGRNAEILLQVAAARTSDMPLVTTASPRSMLVATLNAQLARLGATVRTVASGVKSNMVTYLMPGGGIVRQTGAGLQAFGIYNSVRALSAAIERGDSGQAVLQAAGQAAQGSGLGIEAAIPALGRALQAGNLARFNAFAASSLGQRLGGSQRLGLNIGRSGAAVGTAVTLPFALHTAITSFQQAARTRGDQAQDHYVDGTLATAGAALAVGTAAAAFAGVAAAGPLGLIAGLGLAVGGGIYHSVRYVDQLDRHAGLSAGERLVTGLGSLVGVSTSQDIEDRAAVGRARAVYNLAKRQQMQTILQEKGWRVAIYGDAVITPQAPLQREIGGVLFDPYNAAIEWVQQPAAVTDNAADDSIDASAGLRGIANRVRNRAAAHDTVLWATGDGRDRLLGVDKRVNVFSLRRGVKAIRGGQRDDVILLDAIPEHGSVFDGGDGVDTLVLRYGGGAGDAASSAQVVLDSHDLPWEWDGSPATYIEVDQHGNEHVRRKFGNRVSPARDAGSLVWNGRHSALRSIENVITATGTATSVVGNGRDNVFVLNGHGDSAAGQGGDDTYIVNGGGSVTLHAGGGNNRFRLGRGIEAVAIRSWSGRQRMMLEFDLAEIEARVVADDLVLALNDDGARKQVRMHDLLRRDADGTQVARHADGDLMLYTRDGYALAPLLSGARHAEEGLIELAATPTTGAQAQAMELLIQYAGTLAAATTGAGTSASGLASTQSVAQLPLATPALS